MHCKSDTFVYHEEFTKYMKMEGGTSKDIYDYLFDTGGENFLSERGKKYLHAI